MNVIYISVEHKQRPNDLSSYRGRFYYVTFIAKVPASQTMGGKGKAYRLTTELEHHMMRDNTTPLGAYDPEVGRDWIRLMTMIMRDDAREYFCSSVCCRSIIVPYA